MNATSPSAELGTLDLLAGHPLNIRNLSPSTLSALGRKARTHSKAQLAQLAQSIRSFGFAVPVLVDEQDRVIAGNARVAAAVQLGLETIPVVTLAHLSADQKRAFVLAENKLASLAGWDKAVLRLEFAGWQALDLDFDLEVTGFLQPEVDALVFGEAPQPAGDHLPAMPVTPISRPGDLWLLGRHRLLCGDATDTASVASLLAGEQVRTVFTDPPYNVRIGGHVTSAGQHGEFVMASGEMSEPEFTGFLERTFVRLEASLMPGGLAYVCMDFRHMRNVLDAADATGLKLLNLIDCLEDPFGDLVDHNGIGTIREKDSELVCAKTGNEAGAGHGSGEALGDSSQQRVTDRVAEGVVDVLEPIQIEQKQCARPSANSVF